MRNKNQSALLLLLLLFGTAHSLWAQTEERQMGYAAFTNQRYSIEIDLDHQQQSLAGQEIVRFTNATRRDLDQINFYLYPNLGQESEEIPWLSVQGVSLIQPRQIRGQGIRYALKARNSVLQIKLPFKLAAGASLELKIEFVAQVPRIQREETTLFAHFLEEANDAMSDEKQARDARDIFFACDQSMLLGYFYPILASPDLKSTELGQAIGVGGLVNTDIADYVVKVRTNANIAVVASAPLTDLKTDAEPKDGADGERISTRIFSGQKMRGFALAISERLKKLQHQVAGTEVNTYFLPNEENVGGRMAQIATNAVSAYSAAFGAYPYPQLAIVEMPLPAGFGGIEFPGLIAIAQAYCIDFDSPAAARLPGLIREQSDVIKNALEFTLAQSTAFQWWGSVVGSDSQRVPYLDAGLAYFAATYYYEASYGKAAKEQAITQNLRQPYQVYRSLGGLDLEAAKPIKEYRNALQFSAIVQAKSAMLLHAIREELGDEQFFAALRLYYTTHRFRFAAPNDLRDAFIAASHQQNNIKVLFQRYLKEKRGDEDLGKPEVTYFDQVEKPKGKKIGRFFVKIGRVASHPF